MIYVDENEPVGEIQSQFNHRRVTFKRQRDVRTVFQMQEEIGRGKFGRVMRCKKKDTGEIFAAKFVTCTRREDRRNVEREVEIMNCLKSPKLLQLYDAYDNGRNEMCLITEYIGGGELFDRVIEDEFVLTEKACSVFMKQILDGISYIHDQQIIHLDLKPENVLCLTKTGNRIKIIDFGLARKFEPLKKLQILFGTPEFVAPEVVNFEPIGYSTDMWALGVICYVLLSGLSPFMGDTDLETMANVTIAEYDYEDEAFDNISEEAKDFVDKLLVKDKEKRATADQCLAHPWMKMSNDDGRSGNLIAKDNLNSQVGAWNKRDSRYYLFDSESKTASQLFEMNICVSPRLLEDLPQYPKDDPSSFFTTDGAVRNQIIRGEGEAKVPLVTINESEPHPNALMNIEGVRKRSIEDVRPPWTETDNDTIDYIGLVKRPKTPLITAEDIHKQADEIYDKKHSVCGTVSDLVIINNEEVTVDISDPFNSDEDSVIDLTEDNENICDDPVMEILELEETADEVVGCEVSNLTNGDVLGENSDAGEIKYVQEGEASEDHLENIVVSINNQNSLILIDNNNVDEKTMRAKESQCEVFPLVSLVDTDGVSEQQESFLDHTVQVHNSGDNESAQQQQPCEEDSLNTNGIIKTYTVEDGFDRPEQGWAVLESQQTMPTMEEVSSEMEPTESEKDYWSEEDIEEDKKSVQNTRSSSCLPSESDSSCSGTFYKTAYILPITPTLATTGNVPANVKEDRDSEDARRKQSYLQNVTNPKTHCNRHFGVRPRKNCSTSCVPRTIGMTPKPNNSVCKSKSDEKIHYKNLKNASQIPVPMSFREESPAEKSNDLESAKFVNSVLARDVSLHNEPVKTDTFPSPSKFQVPFGKALAKLPKSPKTEEVFDLPWTEVSGDSPENKSSNDNLTSTISSEMQQLLSSIQSLGKTESSDSQSGGWFSEVKCENGEEPKLRQPPSVDSIDFTELMKEVENQIRFSASRDLLESMDKSPTPLNLLKERSPTPPPVPPRPTDLNLYSRVKSPSPKNSSIYKMTSPTKTELPSPLDQIKPQIAPKPNSPTRPFPVRILSKPKSQTPPRTRGIPRLQTPPSKSPSPSRPVPPKTLSLSFKMQTPSLKTLSPTKQNYRIPTLDSPLQSPQIKPELSAYSPTGIPTYKSPKTSPSTNGPSSITSTSGTSFTSPEASRRFYSNLPRPSDMPSAGQQTSLMYMTKVPDMLSKISDSFWDSTYPNSEIGGKYSSPTISSTLKRNGSRNGSPGKSNPESVREDLTHVRNEISSIRDQINTAKNEISIGGKPLLEIFQDCNNTVKNYKHQEQNNNRYSGSKYNSAALHKDLMETKKAMKDIKKTAKSFNKQMSLPSGCSIKQNENRMYEEELQPSSKRIFGSVNQGSVNKAKNMFEQKEIESKVAPKLQGPRQRSITPFCHTRTPSPSGPESQMRSRTNTGSTKTSFRRRSPSPVVTGKVNSFRTKFDEKQNGSSSSINSNTTSLPRTFRMKTPEYLEVNQSVSRGRLPGHFVNMSQSPAVVRKPMTGTSLYNNISLNGSGNLKRTTSVREEHKPWQQTNGKTTGKPVVEPRKSSVNDAASFLRSTLPRPKRDPGKFSLENVSVKKKSDVRGPFGMPM